MNQWKQNVVGMLGMFALGLAFGPTIATSDDSPAIQKLVKAQEFVLVDAEGNKRAELSFGPAGAAGKVEIDEEEFEKRGRDYVLEQTLKGPWPRLTFFDHEGRERLIVGVSAFADTPTFRMIRPDGSEAVKLNALRNASQLVLTAPGDDHRMSLWASENAGAILALEHDSSDGVALRSYDKGYSLLSFTDANKRRRIAIGLQKNGMPHATIYDAEGQQSWHAP